MLALGFSQRCVVQWRDLITGEKLHWSQVNPGPCRQHGHCCKHAKPLHHMDCNTVTCNIRVICSYTITTYYYLHCVGYYYSQYLKYSFLLLPVTGDIHIGIRCKLICNIDLILGLQTYLRFMSAVCADDDIYLVPVIYLLITQRHHVNGTRNRCLYAFVCRNMSLSLALPVVLF